MASDCDGQKTRETRETTESWRKEAENSGTLDELVEPKQNRGQGQRDNGEAEQGSAAKIQAQEKSSLINLNKLINTNTNQHSFTILNRLFYFKTPRKYAMFKTN